ncbi:MAG: FAD-dependent oxidoreductase [Rhodocyclaceae bacterium]|nr:FAD-dependent oxidoreductase [Rhodocyclaceae bacterium]
MNTFPPRAETLARLEAHEWDLVVIGGGISGAGVAQQAAQRGWSVLLVEQRDFAWGTSSRSSKLVHGGLRYLKEGDLKTTLHSVRERNRLLREAPGLVEPQSFLFADCPGRKPGRWLMQTGLVVYDLMAGQRSHFHADLATTQALAPGLAPPGLRGALVFQDAKTDDARLVLRVLQEARLLGATTLNYVAASGLRLEGGRITGLNLHDALGGNTYAVRARCVVNATGAWADRLRAGVDAAPLLRPLRGSHLLVPFWRLPVAQSISLMHPRDGRPVFLYPWEGATLIGTTDLDHAGSLDTEASITPAEVDYLIEAVNDQFPLARLTPADITACYAGVRPVLDDGQKDASKATRDHVVRDESGLVTLTGGKLTTFRLIALDALKHAAPLLPGWRADLRIRPVFSPSAPLPMNSALPALQRKRLQGRYGKHAAALLECAGESELEAIPGTETVWAELRWAARAEAVMHLEDLLLRRTRLGLQLREGGAALMPRIRAICQPELGWDDARWEREQDAYLALWRRHYDLPPHHRIPDWRKPWTRLAARHPLAHV